MTTRAWEEVIKQYNLANAKLEPLCQQKPFQTREVLDSHEFEKYLVFSSCTGLHRAVYF